MNFLFNTLKYCLQDLKKYKCMSRCNDVGLWCLRDFSNYDYYKLQSLLQLCLTNNGKESYSEMFLKVR